MTMRMLRLGIAAGVAAALIGGASAAPDPAAPAKSGRYVDPKARFSLAVPPNAELVEQGEPIHLSIVSPKGYRITVQTGRADPNLSLADMTRRLEGQYFGASGPWSAKLGQRTAAIGGLGALDTIYEGARLRSRVVIMRGRNTDFVIVFSAPSSSFEGLVGEFDAVLASFQPGPRESVAGPAAQAPAPTAAPAAPSPPVARRRFADDALGYAIEIPGDWVVERPSAFTVVFSGESGRDAYFTTVSIQNIDASAASEPGERVGRVLADLRAGLDRRAKGVSYFGEAPFTYNQGGVRLDGRQVLVEYVFEGQRFRQWTLVVPRSGGAIIHVWSYASPTSQFDATRSTAEAMLKSWVLSDRRADRS